MTRARLRFPSGNPIEVELDDVAAYGPEITGFRAWLGAVSASDQGRWVIRFADETVLGFQRSELKRIRLTPSGADITLGAKEAARTLTAVENDGWRYYQLDLCEASMRPRRHRRGERKAWWRTIRQP